MIFIVPEKHSYQSLQLGFDRLIALKTRVKVLKWHGKNKTASRRILAEARDGYRNLSCGEDGSL